MDYFKILFLKSAQRLFGPSKWIVAKPQFFDHLMLRKFFGGDPSAELILPLFALRILTVYIFTEKETLHGESHDPHGILSLEVRVPSSTFAVYHSMPFPSHGIYFYF